VPGVAELIEQGIKLYMSGRLREAREAFQHALDQDPRNAKARSYLVHIRDATPALTPFPGGLDTVSPGGAVPLPAPALAVAAPRAAVTPPAVEPPPSAAVPLPAPAPAAPPPPAEAAAPAATLDAATADHHDEYVPSPWDEGPAARATIELDSVADGLDLEAVAEKSDLRPLVPEGARPLQAAASTPKNDVEVWLSAAKELFALGDFSGSLELIEKILQLDPDHGEARDYLRQNEATLVSMYESKLGSLTKVPRLAIKPEEVMWLNLDHRAGFLLAQIDGSVDYESLFALSGLPRLDTARILANLIAEGVITS
jgi:tetratricopeptide (TPR) repeat protein